MYVSQVQSVPVVQSHISSKDIDDIINDRDADTENTASKSSAKAVKGGAGKTGSGKKATTVRGKVGVVIALFSNRVLTYKM